MPARPKKTKLPVGVKLPPGSALIPAKAYDALMAARQHQADWANVEAEARRQIEVAMGDNDTGVLLDSDDEIVVKIDWKPFKTTVFNQTKHKEQRPDCHEEFTELVPRRNFIPRDKPRKDTT